MKVTVFTGNQPRHLNLAKKIAAVADEVCCIQEARTVRPGLVDDFLGRMLWTYFSNVMGAEKTLFGDLGFMPSM